MIFLGSFYMTVHTRLLPTCRREFRRKEEERTNNKIRLSREITFSVQVTWNIIPRQFTETSILLTLYNGWHQTSTNFRWSVSKRVTTNQIKEPTLETLIAGNSAFLFWSIHIVQQRHMHSLHCPPSWLTFLMFLTCSEPLGYLFLPLYRHFSCQEAPTLVIFWF